MRNFTTTTIRLPAPLWREAKKHCVETDQTISAFIIDILVRQLKLIEDSKLRNGGDDAKSG